MRIALAEQSLNAYIMRMIVFQKEALKARPAGAAPQRAAARLAAVPHAESAWRVLPLEGRFEIAYADAGGRASRRRIAAAELKVGPGKLLLGGVDAALDAYRGFRVDRIRSLKVVETGEVVARNIVDWLLGEAERQARERRRAEAVARKPAKPAKAAGLRAA